MLHTSPSRTRLHAGAGRHAADGDQLLVRVRGDLDDGAAAELADLLLGGRRLRAGQLVVVHLGGCDFVNVRGFRALLRLQDEVVLLAGQLLVVDPPRALHLICRSAPGRLSVVPTLAESVGREEVP